MKIILSGIENDSINTLTVTIFRTNIEIELNNVLINTFSFEEIGIILKKYNNNYGTGVPFTEREFTRLFSNNKRNTVVDNLIRAFAISNGFLHIESKYSNSNEYFENLKDTFLQHLYNVSLIDWTGDLGDQPSIYFIKHELIEQNRNGVYELFKLGILYKYEAVFDDSSNLESYFIPLVLPDVKNYKYITTQGLWKKILNDRDKEMQKFNKR